MLRERSYGLLLMLGSFQLFWYGIFSGGEYNVFLVKRISEVQQYETVQRDRWVFGFWWSKSLLSFWYLGLWFYFQIELRKDQGRCVWYFWCRKFGRLIFLLGCSVFSITDYFYHWSGVTFSCYLSRENETGDISLWTLSIQLYVGTCYCATAVAGNLTSCSSVWDCFLLAWFSIFWLIHLGGYSIGTTVCEYIVFVGHISFSWLPFDYRGRRL